MKASHFTDALNTDVFIGAADSTARTRLTVWVASVPLSTLITPRTAVAFVTDAVTGMLLCTTNALHFIAL